MVAVLGGKLCAMRGVFCIFARSNEMDYMYLNLKTEKKHRKGIDSLNALVQEVNLEAGSSGISLQAMDNFALKANILNISTNRINPK